MDSVVLYNQNGQKFDVNVTRYFKIDGNKYFIFNLNEIDNNGYLQLYVSKVINSDNGIVMTTISDENEWNLFKQSIEKIVTNNRNNILNDGDLDFTELNGTTVSQFRIFKLREEHAKLLGDNKNVKPLISEEHVETIKEEPQSLQAASAQDTGLSIEEILKKVSEGAKSAREEVKVNLNQNVTPSNEDTEVSYEESNEKPRVKTIDELLNSINNTTYDDEPVTISNVQLNNLPETEEETEELPTSEIVPEPSIDYESKYKELLAVVDRLEEENMRLINELIDAKAKIATIKDIIK